MRIAYLVNQYPKVSHSFIRREIAALESIGLEVERYSIRRTTEALPDAADEAEKTKTRVLLDAGALRLASAFGAALAKHPRRALKTLGRVLRAGLSSDQGVVRHLAYLAESALLLDWARRDNCSHVHAHFGTNPATVAMLCHEIGGPSYSFTTHGPEEFDKAATLLLPEKIAGATFVAAVSSFGKAQLQRLCSLEQWDKIHIVRCGVEHALLEVDPTPVPEARRLVCVGRLCAQKAQLVLVEAAARLRAEGTVFELVLVGDGEMRPQVEAAIARFGLEGCVQITGWASASRVRSELESARAMVLPSFAEGLPVVIMEAFALGRPVISTYVAGIPELVVPGESGWLVPAGSVADLASAMRLALNETPDRLSKMGQNGRSRVRQLHDTAFSGRKLAALFRGEAVS